MEPFVKISALYIGFPVFMVADDPVFRVFLPDQPVNHIAILAQSSYCYNAYFFIQIGCFA